MSEGTGFPACERLAALVPEGATREEAKAYFTPEQWQAIEDEWSVLFRWFNDLHSLMVELGLIAPLQQGEGT